MKVVIYEDNYENFYPLINFYPQFNLRIGMKTIAENIRFYFPKAEIDYIARDVLKLKKVKPAGPTVYLSSRLIMTQKINFTPENKKFLINSVVVGFIKSNPPFPNNLKEIKKTVKTIKKTKKVSGFVLNHVWDLIQYIHLSLDIVISIVEGK